MSHLHLRNSDFDQVLAAFRGISQPDNLAVQLRAQDQPKRRLRFAIRRDYREAYARSVALDKFGTEDLDELTEAQLTMLRNTLANRPKARRERPAKQVSETCPF
jgi:hypothetical protein